jgi:hypothetical protein
MVMRREKGDRQLDRLTHSFTHHKGEVQSDSWNTIDFWLTSSCCHRVGECCDLQAAGSNPCSAQ